MTARDTLLPAIVQHDGRDLQSYMGVYGAIQSLAVIVGPALAASALISAFGVHVAAAALCAAWLALTVFALVAKSMRSLD